MILDRDELSSLLDDPNELSAVRLLELAMRWVADEAQQLADRDEVDDVRAFEFVAGLDDALAATGELAVAVPSVVGRARGGQSLTSFLGQRLEQLDELDRRLAEERQAKAELAATEERLRARASELDEIGAIVAEIRRLERYVTALDELQSYASELGQHVEELRAIVADESNLDLDRLTNRVVTLSDTAVASLTPDVAKSVEVASASQAALAEQQARHVQATAEAEEAIARAAALRSEVLERRAELRAHQQADRDVLTALEGLPAGDGPTGLDALRHQLDGVDEQLRDLDGRLADVQRSLAVDADRSERVRPWSP